MQINNTYYIKQGIVDVAPCVNWPARYRIGDTDTRTF